MGSGLYLRTIRTLIQHSCHNIIKAFVGIGQVAAGDVQIIGLHIGNRNHSLRFHSGAPIHQQPHEPLFKFALFTVQDILLFLKCV